MKLPPDEDSESSSADNTQSQQDVDFSDYMWMGEEMEEFDSKVSNILSRLLLLNIIYCLLHDKWHNK